MWKKLTNINRILVPVDLTDDSLCAVEAAQTFAGTKKTQIYLIHVRQKAPRSPGQDPVPDMKAGRARISGEYPALEESFMRKIKSRSSFAFIVRSGIPSDEVLTFAREEAVDLIVLPAGGREPVFSGGTSCRIIENSSVPVLIVKPEPVVKKKPGSGKSPTVENNRTMPYDERYLQEIRQRICLKCIDRTPSGICVTVTFDSCAINRFLPEIINVVLTTKGPALEAYVKELRENVCVRCEHQSPDGICDTRDDLECALDRYFPLVVEAILDVSGKPAESDT